MFPQDLLENNKKVRPVDVKIIEHDGYIDYEIEFLDMDTEGDEYMYEYYTMDEDKEDGGTSTGLPGLITKTTTHPGSRIRHRFYGPFGKSKETAPGRSGHSRATRAAKGSRGDCGGH